MSISRHVVALFVFVFLGGEAVAAPAPPNVACTACAVADPAGRLIWGRSARAPLPNASTTKIVTALVVSRETSPDEPVRVSTDAAATQDGYLAFEAGETLSVEDMLHGLLMASSNDAAVALAEHVGGTEEAFVEEMNRTAGNLGAKDTNFETPHGLDTPGHVSSARDLAIFGAALLEKRELAAIVSSTSYTLDDGTTITNSNPLLEGYEGATGVKTGMTLQAGEVLVASAERDGFEVLAVALGSPDASADAADLLDFGFRLARSRAPAPVVQKAARGIVSQVNRIGRIVANR